MVPRHIKSTYEGGTVKADEGAFRMGKVKFHLVFLHHFIQPLIGLLLCLLASGIYFVKSPMNAYTVK